MHELHNDLPYLPESIKIEKVEKLVTNLHDKTKYVIQIRNKKQAINHGLILKNFGMNTKLSQKSKNNFEKDFLKFMINVAFGKTMENVRKHKNIKLVTTERRRNYLVSEQNYHSTKFFAENVLAIEMRKTQILRNKPVYIDLSILDLKDLSKTVMYEFWSDYIKPKYGKNAKLCYMDTDSFIVYVKTDDIYKGIAEDVETRFYTSNF